MEPRLLVTEGGTDEPDRYRCTDATVMICISGCGPSESQPTERQRFEATEKLLSANYYSPNADYIRVLISEGADVNARSTDGSTPLMIAAWKSSTPEIVQLLLEKGAELEARNTAGWTPLMYAARKFPRA